MLRSLFPAPGAAGDPPRTPGRLLATRRLTQSVSRAVVMPRLSLRCRLSFCGWLAFLFLGLSGCALNAAEPGLASGTKSWFNADRVNVLVTVLLLSGLILRAIARARAGESVFIRRIGGLDAIDDAVGRAAEMGRPALFLTGGKDMDNIETMAAVTILGHVAGKTADCGVSFLAPMNKSFVMTVAQETARQAYQSRGRGDAFQADQIRYLTDDQFSFTAGVGGIQFRERPGACFYFGNFGAESLILAENGASVGAIQIAGTAEGYQIPFFVAACDYTLIGEELFAASAYLSRDPREIGALMGQDTAKIVIMSGIVFGVFVFTLSRIPGLQDSGLVSMLHGMIETCLSVR